LDFAAMQKFAGRRATSCVYSGYRETELSFLRAGYLEDDDMAKTKRKYSPGAGKDVEDEMRRFNRGTAKSGKGGKVKSRKQAIAIGLSKARKEGKRVPKKAA
jgi:Family of unknown function (DUF6496)